MARSPRSVHALEAMSRSPRDPPVRVQTSTGLRRAGLERALVRANVTPAFTPRETFVLVRTTDDESCHAPIELAVGAEAIELTIRAKPDPGTWALLGRIVHELLIESGERSSPRDQPAEVPTSPWAHPTPHEG